MVAADLVKRRPAVIVTPATSFVTLAFMLGALMLPHGHLELAIGEPSY
jgi:hypothetical protein